MRLHQALEQCDTPSLLRIGAAEGVSMPEAATRDEMVRVLLEPLASPDRVQRLLGGEVSELRPVLERVAASGGIVRGYELRRWLDEYSPEERRAAAEATLNIGRLLEHGLLFRIFVSDGLKRGEAFILPEEFHSLVGPGAQDGPPRPRQVSPPPAYRELDSAFELFALGSYLRRHRGERPAAYLSEHGAETEPGQEGLLEQRGRFLLSLALAVGCLERHGVRALPNSLLEELLERRGEVVATLWEQYLCLEEWDDLLEAGISRTPLAGRRRPARVVRQQIISSVAGLEEGSWYLLEDVVEFIRRTAPDFLREHYESTAAGLLETGSGTVLQGPESWMLVEARLVRFLCQGPLYWLGLTAQGKDAEGYPLISLTPTGAALGTGAMPLLRPPLTPARLERDGGLTFPRSGDLAAMYQLEVYLTLLHRADVSEYRLDQDAFLAGLAAGGSLEHAERVLSRLLRSSLPERVSRTLATWAAAYGRVRLRPALLMTFEGEEVPPDLLERKEVAPFVRERLGSRAARVSGTDVKSLVSGLRKLGLYPRVDASLRLMAGRGAYASLVDEHVLEGLFVSLEVLRRLSPTALERLEFAAELRTRLRAALGGERVRKLNGVAREILQEFPVSASTVAVSHPRGPVYGARPAEKGARRRSSASGNR